MPKKEVRVWLEPKIVSEIDELVKEGYAHNRSELIRIILLDSLVEKPWGKIELGSEND